MNEVWYISDLHLGHEKILAFNPFLRPYKTIEEHDNAILENWNKVVKPKDTIWVLGDISVAGPRKLECIRRLTGLNGYKRLVLGNHDPSALEFFGIFHTIHGAFADGTRQWLYTHFPVHPSQLGTRFVANIHGHMHGHKIDDPRYLNVSCEQTGCTPINREEVKLRLQVQHDSSIS